MKLRAVGDLLSDQIVKFREWSKEWEAACISNAPADFDRASQAIFAAYKISQKGRRAFWTFQPKVILRMGSPFGAALGGLMALDMLKSLGTDAPSPQIEDQVRLNISALLQNNEQKKVDIDIAVLWQNLGIHRNRFQTSPVRWLDHLCSKSVEMRVSPYLRSYLNRHGLWGGGFVNGIEIRLSVRL